MHPEVRRSRRMACLGLVPGVKKEVYHVRSVLNGGEVVRVEFLDAAQPLDAPTVAVLGVPDMRSIVGPLNVETSTVTVVASSRRGDVEDISSHLNHSSSRRPHRPVRRLSWTHSFATACCCHVCTCNGKCGG